MQTPQLETVAAAIAAGQEITPEHSRTRVVLYRTSIILVHPAYTMVLCADCGQVKSAFVIDADGTLSQDQCKFLQTYLKALQRVQSCDCPRGDE